MNGPVPDLGSAGAPPRASRPVPTVLPPVLDRRFEAVVLWSPAPSIGAGTARQLLALRDAGMPVAWMAPAPTDRLAGRLAGGDTAAATLVLADCAGTDLAVVDGSGLRPAPAPAPGAGTDALDRAATALVARLSGSGVAATVRPRAGGSLRAAVVLEGIAGQPSGRPGLKRLLTDHGIPGVPGLASLAEEAAGLAGIDEPRVVVGDGHVEIALVDAGDVAVAVLQEFWRRGVDPGSVLVVLDGPPDLPHRPAPVLVPDVREATVVLVNGGRGAAVTGVTRLAGGTARLHRLLADQLRRRRRRTLPDATVRRGWSVTVDGFDPEHERVHEALLALANGHVGMSGAPLGDHPACHRWVIAAGVYTGEDAACHLLTGPVTSALGGRRAGSPLRRVLDLRTGVLHERTGAGDDTVESLRFVSPGLPATAVLRARHRAPLRAGPPVLPAADDPSRDGGRAGQVRWLRVAGVTGGITAAAVQTRWRPSAPRARGPDVREDAPCGVLDRVAAYDADPDTLPDPSRAVDAAARASAVGFDRLLDGHRRAWAHRWEDADVVIDGDDDLQSGIRFALFHLMASAADTGEAPVGARGLSGTGYGGHVFWDADTFVLPFLAATRPEAARSMLEYRIRRLPAALAAARAAGRGGARFPWESARSGRDVTPVSARDRSGRVVPIRTGQLEEHIVAQVAWAACCYVDWTGDEAFARGPGDRLLVETARYWASRIRVEPDGGAHVYGVVGPDEYHEPVDDNAFTNVMARWNLRRAAEALDASGGDVDVGERRRWTALADALVDGYDADTGIYEQFAGFHRLEPLVIAEIAPRRPIAADLLLGSGRTRGAQVIKQADVLMIHHLLPDEAEAGSLEPNLRHYEPRTAHGSSLSPAVHASLHARARDFDRALAELRIAVHMDLDDLTGSTAQGLHLATMGGVWQAVAFGFMGLRPSGGMLRIDPVLPPAWSAIDLRLRFHGSRVRVRKERARLAITADRPVQVLVGGTAYTAGPGDLGFRRRGSRWEVQP